MQMRYGHVHEEQTKEVFVTEQENKWARIIPKSNIILSVT
jgi:hypothetical protein